MTDHETDEVRIVYIGPIDDSGYEDLVDLLSNEMGGSRVRFHLCTYGGSGDAAYKIGRLLQHRFGQVDILVTSACKSAGTLVACAGHKLVMTEFAELGPLDVQILKRDEMFERVSGLDYSTALNVVKQETFEHFAHFMLEIKRMSGGSVTLATSMQVASAMASGLFSEIVKQIDPAVLGSYERSLQVAEEYANRLFDWSKNGKPGAANSLIRQFPDHGFVIDSHIASTLFDKVDQVNSASVDGVLAPKRMNDLLNRLSRSGMRYVLFEPEFVKVFSPNSSEAESDQVPQAEPAESQSPEPESGAADGPDIKPEDSQNGVGRKRKGRKPAGGKAAADKS